MKKLASLAAALALCAGGPASAAVIVGMNGGEDIGLPESNAYNGACCKMYTAYFDKGTFTANNSHLYGYMANYEMEGGTFWEGSPAVYAFSTLQTEFNFTFDAPVSSILAEFTWGNQIPQWEPLTISVFNAAGDLLESLVLADGDFSLQRGTYGFARDTAEIHSMRISGAYYGVRDIMVDGVGIGSAVPEPATWAMMITGFGLAGQAVRRRRTALQAA